MPSAPTCSASIGRLGHDIRQRHLRRRKDTDGYSVFLISQPISKSLNRGVNFQNDTNILRLKQAIAFNNQWKQRGKIELMFLN